MEEENLNLFFATISAELGAYKKFEKLAAPQLAPDFNMVSCLCPDENRLSKVLAMLLDPNGVHGQGDTFIHLFLDIIMANAHHVNIIDILRKNLKLGRSKTKLEVATSMIENCQRRIDILLDLGVTGLAIENKPWARDQEKQIEDYIEHLDKIYSGNFLIIYLSGNGAAPVEESLTSEKRAKLEKSGHFLVFNYLDLRNWIRLCAEKSRSIRVQTFLEDFASYITLEFEGGLTIMEEQLIIDQAIKKENIGAAFAVGTSWPKIAKKLIIKLKDLVVKEADLPGTWESEEDFDLYGTYSSITFKHGNWKHYKIRFQFDSTNANNLAFGICKENENIRDLPEYLKQILNESKLGNGLSSTWWPWRQNFSEPYRNWGDCEEPWVGINECGATVQLIAGKLKDLMEICEFHINNIEEELKTSPL
ncbi:MAG: PD-(D/E)XK nuclease family protein [Geobacteraceae bacterium]|nr:PD-(D/E)XK nuclease family protein [Geobacteraceae bacterium]